MSPRPTTPTPSEPPNLPVGATPGTFDSVTLRNHGDFSFVNNGQMLLFADLTGNTALDGADFTGCIDPHATAYLNTR